MTRSPPPPKPASIESFAFAARMAREYFELGVRQYNRMASPIRHDQSARGRLSGLETTGTEQSISAAMILSFAVELTLKALIAQRSFVFPQEHNIEALMQHLTSEVRSSVANRYEGLRSTQSKLLKFELGRKPSVDTSPANTDDFDLTIKNVANLFVGLRYLHEEFGDEFSVTLDFHWLVLMCQALTDEIEAHREGQLIAYGSKHFYR